MRSDRKKLFDSTKWSLWRNPYGFAMMTYYALMALVGLLIPDDILRSNAWARDFSDFMASIVPQINQITALNIKPDVNRFYFSLLWGASPLFCVMVIAELIDGKKRNYGMWHSGPRAMLRALAAVVFVVFCSCNLWWVDPGSRLTYLIFSNPVGRSVIGSIALAHAPVLCATGALLWMFAWGMGCIKSNVERQRHD